MSSQVLPEQSATKRKVLPMYVVVPVIQLQLASFTVGAYAMSDILETEPAALLSTLVTMRQLLIAINTLRASNFFNLHIIHNWQDILITCITFRYISAGLHKCQCKFGYEGDGIYCSEINPCLNKSNSLCHENAQCRHTGPNRHNCVCNDMYTGDGKTCSPVDACNTGQFQVVCNQWLVNVYIFQYLFFK